MRISIFTDNYKYLLYTIAIIGVIFAVIAIIALKSKYKYKDCFIQIITNSLWSLIFTIFSVIYGLLSVLLYFACVMVISEIARLHNYYPGFLQSLPGILILILVLYINIKTIYLGLFASINKGKFLDYLNNYSERAIRDFSSYLVAGIILFSCARFYFTHKDTLTFFTEFY